jgi:hypothetical protein
MKKVLLIVLLASAFVSCRKEYYDNDDPISRRTDSYSGKTTRDYFTLICKVSKTTPGFFPPQVARAYGYIGLANYEAVVNGIPGAQSLGGQLNGLTRNNLPQPSLTDEYNWSIASNAAIAEMIRRMFEIKITAANLYSIDSTEQKNLAELSAGVSREVVERSITFGKKVTEAIYEYSKTDGGHHSYLDPFQLPYTVQVDPRCWVPTSAVTTPISPYWGNNRPFILSNVTNTEAMDPIVFSTSSTSAFYNEAKLVYNQVKNNTSDQVQIAKYWADDPFNTCTPAGHTFNILTQLLLEDNATLEKTAVAYAKMSIAENDAFIACWRGKYKHILIRPVSYIKLYIDPNFNTVIGTPAFPAYTSGHSCEIGAGSKIFTAMFTNGNGNYKLTDYSQLQYGFPARTYNNFDDMADECANSRLYAGIHYPMDNVRGLEIGRAVGINVNNLLRWPLNSR